MPTPDNQIAVFASFLRPLAITLLAIAVACLTAPAIASLPFKLTASDADASDEFGSSVAISGDTAIVGSLGDDDAGNESGAAYIYRWIGSGWVQEAKLTAADPAAGDEFGFSVAISGDTAIVGSLGDDDAGTNSGAAYVFVRTGSSWTQQAKLTAADPAAGDEFGFSVAISGDTAIVGAFLDDDAGSSSGAAYVFVRTGSSWTQQAKLTADDAAAGDSFGISVAISGDSAIVGSVSDDDAGSRSGSAYVFTRTGSSWTQQAKLTANDAAQDDRFGSSVAISGDNALVGSNLDDDGGTNSGSAYVFARSGSSWTQQAKLTAADPAAGDEFGFSVAISGDTAIVGAYLDDDAGSSSGSAYVFVRTGSSWTQQAKLTADDAATGDRFGGSVVISGDTAIVGALGDNDAGFNSGSAYVFERIGPVWVGADQKIVASDAAASDLFGFSVAISGDTAIVGSHFDDDAGSDSGSAYVFVRTGSSWSQQAKLTADDAAASDNFGRSVAISGDTAIVGAWLDDDAGSFSGSAYVFTRSGSSWTQQAKLTAADAAPGDNFGWSVAISGDTAIVGAIDDDDAGSNSGAAYVFTRSGSSWSQQAKLTASDAAPGDEFGSSVAISGDTAIIGASRDEDAGSNSGAAYVFTRSGSSWSQQAKLTADDAALGDRFGFSVAISGDTAIVGSLYDDDAGSDSGSAYVFVRTSSSWTQQAKLTAGDAAADDEFGVSVAISGDTAIVGAYLDDDAGTSSGSAYVFTRTGSSWSEQAKLTAADAAPGDEFGYSVAISGDTAIIGAHEDDDAGSSSGSAYLFFLDERFPPIVRNTTSGSLHDSLAGAINAASPTHFLLATPTSFWDAAPTDYITKPLSITATGRIRQPWLNSTTLANGASLNAASDAEIILHGLLDVPPHAASTIRASAIHQGPGGAMTVFAGAALSAQASSVSLDGDTLLLPGATLASSGPLTVAGDLTILDGVLGAPSLRIAHNGRFVGDGVLSTSLTNDEHVITVDSTLITGDLTNNAGATVTVQIGTLTLLGTLTNNGTIVGDLQTLARGSAQTQPGDGFSVGGSYRAGPDASLLMSSDLWRITVGADFDVAIDSNTRYDMARAELRLSAAAPSTIEAMSLDVGPDAEGLDRTLPGHFPLGTLRIAGGVASIVDAHDNDGQGQQDCEAIYTRNLIISAGATLNTNGCAVYYETLTLNGAVDDPMNLIQIAGCPGDTNGDNIVDFSDLNAVLSAFGDTGPNLPADLDGDGFVNFTDLNILLSAFGSNCIN